MNVFVLSSQYELAIGGPIAVRKTSLVGLRDYGFLLDDITLNPKT